MILQHHERLDGSDYPNGLKGEDIIFEARILTVADVVEVITSHRPYCSAHRFEVGVGGDNPASQRLVRSGCGGRLPAAVP